jgi:hypothetical protein
MDSRPGEEPDYAQVYGKGQVTVNRTLIAGAGQSVIEIRRSVIAPAKFVYQVRKGSAQIFSKLRVRTL